MAISSEKIAQTPMMQQFRKIKEQYPDALLLFRCGDFYETYLEDAVEASKILNITLTHRSSGTSQVSDTEMAGFPFHALDTYLPKLVRAGHRVAICDQLEDPKLAKGLVKRGVTELVTPGVSYSDSTLQGKENNFVAAVYLPHSQKRDKSVSLIGISFLDISTGEYLVAEGNSSYIAKLITNFAPKELLYERGKREQIEQICGNKLFTFELDDWMFTYSSATDRLTKQFGTQTLKGFGIERMENGIIAAGAILHYLDLTQHLQTSHIQAISRIEEERYMWLDQFSVRNLELLPTGNTGSSLLEVIDSTATAMGRRTLQQWMLFPLKDSKQIRRRESVVEYFFRHPQIREQISDLISHVGDLQRLAPRISTGRINPREILQLSYSQTAVANIRKLLIEHSSDADMSETLSELSRKINPLSEVCSRIKHTISPNAPAQTSKPDYICNGVDDELDHYRSIQHDSTKYLLDLQNREAERTGIQSLKIGFNNVFGYYLEVRNTYKELVPPEWIRKQTLAQAERYITEELKSFEDQILSAKDKIAIAEQRIFNELVIYLNEFVSKLLVNANVIAQIDCLLSFAVTAQKNKYICPVIDDGLVIDIHGGRHAVIEQQMPIGEEYVANDVMLDNNSQQIIILTGPNMAGKSALLRQTALIVLMAQMGSFVPAESAHIGVVDKIFTRVGASDNITSGESTFMVEMNEAAAILNNLSERSLILFDELGRGTSTYDGISIAWAIVEYIHENPCHAKTLFATHYHELNEMEKSMSRIRNYNVSVREIDNKVIFLRKLVRGGSEHSFGIHVAKMAGMPKSIVARADKILAELEHNSRQGKVSKPTPQIATSREGLQLSIFQLDDPVLEQVRDEIENIDINSLTPLEALNKLSEIKKIVKGER